MSRARESRARRSNPFFTDGIECVARNALASEKVYKKAKIFVNVRVKTVYKTS